MATPRGLAGRILDLALPATCPGCGREGEPICGGCRRALDVRLERPAGAPLGLPATLPAPLVQLDWAAPFNGTVRAALHALKYAGERRLAAPLGAAAAERWRRVGAGGDVIVPVPVHADRARERGFDQAVLLADVIAGRLGLPMAPILERRRRTVAQYELDRAHRRANVAGAFGLRPGLEHRAVEVLAGRWVVLVDDVMTTGSTLAACADALMSAGALAVSGLTVARER